VELFDCPDCHEPAAIVRERQQVCIPTPTGVIQRTEHVSGVWCETFHPHQEAR
jgi:hypothetical protein